MIRVSFVAFACVAFLPIAAAWADDAPPPPPPQGEWTGKGQFGYLSSQGNTESKSVNANLDMARLDGAWKNELILIGLYDTIETLNLVYSF